MIALLAVSPWTILGWMLVAIAAVPITLVLAALCFLVVVTIIAAFT